MFLRRRLIVATALLLAAAGVAAWMTMPREEDPQFPPRDGIAVVRFPGADAAAVERLILEPIEEQLAEVEEVTEVESTARAGVAVVSIELLETIYDTDDAWDEVREALADAELEFPAGASAIDLDDEVILQEAVVLAITGSPDVMALRDAAETVRDGLLGVEGVRIVKRIADPGEQITVAFEESAARRLGLDARSLGSILAGRSRIVPGGQVQLGSKSATLRPHTEFESIAEIESTPIPLPSGASVPLGALGRVAYGPLEPVRSRMLHEGRAAVGLGVIPKQDLDRVAFGARVRDRLDALRAEVAPLEIEEVVFQPEQVEVRLADLSRSLMIAIGIVAAVLFLFMGPRLGFVVVLVVPLVTFASIAVFAAGGGVLHQISIAAVVIALGMLVDNAIVVAENMQYRIDAGDRRRVASVETVRELALPLGTATGTTLAAFVPMLMSKGPTGDFTRAIPILIMLTLTMSYLFAVLVTPVLGELFLRRRTVRETAEDDEEAKPRGVRALLDRAVDGIAGLAVRRAPLVLLAALLLIGLTMVLAGGLRQQFFPSGDRALVVVDLELPEGTHLDHTHEAAKTLGAALAGEPISGAITAFVGRSVPRFYYNLNQIPSSPHLAQFIVQTDSLASVPRMIIRVDQIAARLLPGAAVVARQLEQGPPIEAPIELRLFGEDLATLASAADRVLAELRAIPGSLAARHNAGLGVPTVRFAIDDAAAGRRNVARGDVATALAGRTLGLIIGQYRAGDDPIPVVVRSAAGEAFPTTDLGAIDVAPPGSDPVPLLEVARPEVAWQPAAIYHRDGRREVRVFAQLEPGVTFSEVLDRLRPRLDALDLGNVELAYAGEAAESGRANTAILRALPLGTILLLFFLLAEFNSFRRVVIVLMTVPLAAVGVVPGLLLSGQPFGFMSVLGVFSLVGIVVNNAIVLIDRIERQREGGADLDTALADAVRRRTRPILLTMVTTVAGLLPLALSPTSLWPPLAWAMISGLAASTLLTLMVVPALYKLLFGFGRSPWARGRVAEGVAATMMAMVVVGVALSSPTPATAEPGTADDAVADSSATPRIVTLESALARAVERPESVAADADRRAAEAAAAAIRRATRRPSIAIQGDITARDRDFEFATPVGGLTLGEQVSSALVVEATQPIIDRSRQRYATLGAEARARGALAGQRATDTALRAEAAQRFLTVLAIDAQRETTAAFVRSLTQARDETESRVDAGRSLAADLLKIALDLDDAQLDLRALDRARDVALAELARAIGHAGPVEVASPDTFDLAGDPRLDSILDAALASRQDLQTRVAEFEAAELDAQSVRAERLPRLDAVASFTGTDGDPFRPEALTTAALVVRWQPFTGGARKARVRAAEASREAAHARQQALERAVETQLRAALADLDDARDAVAVRSDGVEMARETLRVERARHAAGRVTTNDLLGAEAALRAQETAHALADIDVLAAWIALDFARGDLKGK